MQPILILVTSIFVFIERFLLNSTRFLSLPKDLEAFEPRVSSSAFSLLMLTTVEPRYLNVHCLKNHTMAPYLILVTIYQWYPALQHRWKKCRDHKGGYCYILTFDRPISLWISKQDVHLCLKVNKGLWKCNANCVGRVWRRPKNIQQQKFLTPDRQ